jgi:hypothetical protein
MEMALRSKAKSLPGLSLAGLLLFGAAAPIAWAQSYTFEVRHRHWRKGAMGTLRISPDEISFEEHGKNGKTDSRSWRYEEIQQLEVSPSGLRILTYEDSKWKLGRDREYIFDRVPKDLAVEAYPLWTSKLDQRFIAAVPAPEPVPEWKVGAKLDHGLSGTLGTLMIGKEQIVFDTGEREGSRSWRLIDIENVSSSGPLDFTVTTTEKSGLFRGSGRQFHFQLQQPLKEDQYSALWRRVNRSKGLTFLDSATAEGEVR